MQNTNCQIECDNSIDVEIENFNNAILKFEITDFKFRQMYQDIKSCITRYLIQDSYNKLNKEQIVDFTKDFAVKPSEEKKMKIEIWDAGEYVQLKNLGNGTASTVQLVYQIETQKLYAIKMQTGNSSESDDYDLREYKNYLQLDYPLLPKLYGIYKENDKYFLKIQFINGQTLSIIKDNGQLQSLKIENKLNIILQLMLIIDYFNKKELVYRDLKPNNVIIDDNKTVFIIDFDRMISENADNLNDQDHTKDFIHEYAAPEVKLGRIAPKSDIYSLGKMIEYIMNNEALEYDFRSFLDENPDNRPSIFDILYDFNSIFSNNIDNLSIKYTPEIQYCQGVVHIDNDIEKSIQYFTLAANQNHPKAQLFLSVIYYEGQYIKRDINKSIHYYTLAANQNIPEAQYNLGLIYYEGKYIEQDINKSIHYFTLAANQNDVQSQYNLGLIYYEGKYIERDIAKSIQYFTLAANQNHPKAQYNLGVIYYEGQYINRNIEKSIQYFTLAAYQNIPKAQFYLGAIYYEGEYVTRDIKKSIYYFTLAANQNISKAQYILGVIYSDGQYIKQDINKSIRYFTLAAHQNIPEAQYILGVIYLDSQYITRDIRKSIQYFTLAAHQNITIAQLILGVIYYEGEYITRDINKSIQYFTLAANQNIPEAQFYLGVIYSDGQYIKQDINKSIRYFTLAANQNIPEAQYILGVIYSSGQCIKRDINKSIQYFTLAANQNHPKAQFNIGLIYYEGQYITRDINKSIHYFALAANQNIPEAHFYLGIVYLNGQYIKRDINKSIQHFALAANQNIPEAQFYLGVIYSDGKYIKRDINKSIHFLILAANQNIPEAQYNLGLVYYEGKYIARDINKSIHYLTLAADRNISKAQYILGIIYMIEKNTNRGLNLLDKSSSAGNIPANFVIGYLYHEGKYVDRNMSKCIKYYKYASSFNNIYSKNNLGVIYKSGFGDEIPKNIGYAIEYFEENVRRWDDKVSMYNLAHIYIYELKTDEKINESIALLIKSSNKNFEPSKFLLCIALIKKHELDLSKIEKELKEKSDNLLKPISKLIFELSLFEENSFKRFEKKYKTIDFLFDFLCRPVQSKYVYIKQKIENLKNITPDFYDGFGTDI